VGHQGILEIGRAEFFSSAPQGALEFGCDREVQLAAVFIRAVKLCRADLGLKTAKWNAAGNECRYNDRIP
jgi:hypothetical protein